MLDLNVNSRGYIDPVVLGIQVSFGESYVEHEDWFLELCLGSLIEFMKIAFQNMSYVYGPQIFTNMLGPALDKTLLHY